MLDSVIGSQDHRYRYVKESKDEFRSVVEELLKNGVDKDLIFKLSTLSGRKALYQEWTWGDFKGAIDSVELELKKRN